MSKYVVDSGTPEQGCITGALPPLTFERGGNGGTDALQITVSYVIP